MVDYKPLLPEGVSLPDGHSIDINHPAYKALVDVAQSERWSQASLTRVLGIEARRVSAEHAARAAAPAPAAPAAKPDMSRWSTSQKLQYALENPKRG
jgi:hypothetical protein